MVGSGSGDGEMAPVGITHGADWTGIGAPSPGAKYAGSLTGPVSFTSTLLLPVTYYGGTNRTAFTLHPSKANKNSRFQISFSKEE